MLVGKEQLAAICAIPDRYYGWTRPDNGVSLVELVASAGYPEIRPQLTAADLTVYLADRPSLIAQHPSLL